MTSRSGLATPSFSPCTARRFVPTWRKSNWRMLKSIGRHDPAVGPIGGGAGVPRLGGRGRGVVPGHLVPVDVGDHPVVEPHPQGQAPDHRGVLHDEGDPNVDRLVHVAHGGDVQPDQSRNSRSRPPSCRTARRNRRSPRASRDAGHPAAVGGSRASFSGTRALAGAPCASSTFSDVASLRP